MTSSSPCPLVSGDPSRSSFCRDSTAASHLKLLSLAVILLASAAGISSPVLLSRLLPPSSLTILKSAAAGVILSTALVHVLPDASAALSDCHVASRHPWRDFPFSGLVSLIGALAALLVDLVASSHLHQHAASSSSPKTLEPNTKNNYIMIEKIGCHQNVIQLEDGELQDQEKEEDEEELARLKQRMVSKVLEIGIIFHSVIIGVTMGMSQNRCTIRPLIVALAFHQVFEGMGLGGCIALVTYIH